MAPGIARLLADLERTWESVTAASSVERRTAVVAGCPIAVESPAPELFDRLWPALSHHLPAPAEADCALVIRMWVLDSEASRPRIPDGVVFERDVTVRLGEHAAVARVRFDQGNRVLMAWDQAAGVAWWLIESIDELQWWEEAAPFRPVLSWFLPDYDRHLAHCAAVGHAEGAVLMVGPGGSGKSTTALACHLDGMGYVGDDYCVVTVDPYPMVHSLYGTAKLVLAEHDEHGPLAGHLMRPTPPPGGKAVALVSARPGAQIVHSARVAMVAAVTVGTGRDTRVVDASRTAVLGALAPSSLMQLPGAGSGSLAALGQLVRASPVCRIELGHQRSGVIDAVRELTIGSAGAGVR